MSILILDNRKSKSCFRGSYCRITGRKISYYSKIVEQHHFGTYYDREGKDTYFYTSEMGLIPYNMNCRSNIDRLNLVMTNDG
jgi:hypothetical protein